MPKRAGPRGIRESHPGVLQLDAASFALLQRQEQRHTYGGYPPSILLTAAAGWLPLPPRVCPAIGAVFAA